MLGGCVTANVDEMTFDAPVAGMGEGSIVILGRRHAPDYDTNLISSTASAGTSVVVMLASV